MSTDSSDAQLRAYILLDDVREQIKNLPRFKGQTQVIGALKRVLNLALWNS